MAFRSEMLESLANLAEPEYPPYLHSIIIESVCAEAASPAENSLAASLGAFFDYILAPLELASVVCVIAAVFFLIQTDDGTELTEAQIKPKAIASAPIAKKVPQKQKANELKPVSPADVEQFLVKLKHFNEHCPEEHNVQNSFSPELRLVNTLSPDY